MSSPADFQVDANYAKLRAYWSARDTICVDAKQKLEFDSMFIAALSNSVEINEWKRLLDKATSAVLRSRSHV
jgi:uncharacterized protein YyaL (SSP411 family)